MCALYVDIINGCRYILKYALRCSSLHGMQIKQNKMHFEIAVCVVYIRIHFASYSRTSWELDVIS